MTTDTLSKQSLEVIERFQNLTFGKNTVPCPYFNNKRSKVRAGLRVLIGKGSVKEIREEVKIICVREKVDLRELSEDDVKKFLVDHNIGIDCSAFVYYVLDAELKASGQKGLRKHLSFPKKSILRRALAMLRNIENVNVKVLAHETNSEVVPLEDMQPGDIITMLSEKQDHVMIMHKVEKNDNAKPAIIHYSHSFSWSKDGKYNHGIKKGKIEIVNLNQNILQQKWIEHEKTGDENETFKRAASADKTEIRRIK